MKEESKNKTGIILILTLLIMAGAFLRFWNLGSASYWVDEVNVVFAAEAWNQTGSPVHPSGVFYGRSIIHTFLVALSYRVLGVNEFASRFISVPFGLLSILLVYFIGKRLFNKRAGLAASFFMTFSHFEVGWSRVAKPYAMLQCFTLILVFLFLLGFESLKKNKLKESKKSNPSYFLRKLLYQLANVGISPLWLCLFLLTFFITFYGVHPLILLVLAGLFAYVLFISFVTYFSIKGKARIINKYSLVSLLGLLAFFLGWMVLPPFRENIYYYLSYIPPWAVHSSVSENKLILFNFLISQNKFPLASFFAIGSIQLVTRKNKQGWISFFIFFISFFLLSFIFTHRVSTYLFHVYPFFLIIAAFGFNNILQGELCLFKTSPLKRKRVMYCGVILLFFLIFIVSPWARISLNIPFIGDGKTNTAVAFNEWREAVHIVKTDFRDGDIIISSLPQVVLAYKMKSDYGLNWSNLQQSIDKNFNNDVDQWVDIYTGTPCIESLAAFESIIQNHNRGWILISQYHFSHEVHLPGEVRTWMMNSLSPPKTTLNKTMLIFHWSIDGYRNEL